MTEQSAPGVVEPQAACPDALTLLAEAAEAFRVLLTPEGVERLEGTPEVSVRWQEDAYDAETGATTYVPGVGLVARFGFTLPLRHTVTEAQDD
jgi:hypothetical protein